MTIVSLAAQTAPPAKGLSKGQKVPNFTLTDQNGKTKRFEDISGPKGAMLVFYRSADW